VPSVDITIERISGPIDIPGEFDNQPISVQRKVSNMHKKLRLGLLFGFISMLCIGNAYARPSFGGDCSVCHIAPTVTNFVLPATHDSLTVPITTFTATDTDNQKSSLAAVTGYMVTTTSTAPGSGDGGWQSTPPGDFTFAADGLQTLYAWAKDTVGNVSAAVSGTVEIALAPTNIPPVADAGPDQTVDEGVTVTLNGSNSDDSDNGIKSFLWEQVGTANPVTLTDPTAEQPGFTAPDVGPDGASLTFRLTVTDNSDATSSDTCIVNVSWVNIAPVADAGADQTVAEGTLVTLDGSASSGVDDTITTYLWEQIDTTGVTAALSDPTAPNPEFTLNDVGADGASVTFQLTVTDQGGLQATDTCVVNVTGVASNQAPVADAGPDQSVSTNAQVTLDASGSTDPDGDTISTTWKQIAGTPVTMSAPGAMNPTFTAPAVAAGATETLTFELTVTDAGQLQATDTCDVQVTGEELPPVEEPPVVEPPVEEPPVVEPPVEEPPVIQPPAEEPPVVQPPANDDDHHDGDYDDDDHEDGEHEHHHNRYKNTRRGEDRRDNKHHREYEDRD
jgi:hypothetical protein